MRGRAEIILPLVVVILLLAALFSSNIFGQKENAQSVQSQHSNVAPIFLKSRQFTPSEKIPTAAQNKISATVNEKGKSRVLIQFDHLPSAEEKKKLAEDGIILLEYIPDKAWLASIQNFGAAKQREDVTFIDSLSSSDKIDPDLISSGIPAYAKNPDGTAKFGVMFFDVSSKEEITNLLNNYGASFEEPAAGGVWKVVLPENKLQDFAADDIVKWVEAGPGPLKTLNDGSRNTTTSNVVQASPYNLNGSGAVLAQWDNGWGNHTDFNSRRTKGDSGCTGAECNMSQHATHVAGTMLGDGSNSASKSGTAAQWRGMATNATYISYEWPDSGASEVLNESNHSVITYSAMLSQNSWGYNVVSNGCGVMGKYDSFTVPYDNITYGDAASINGGQKIIVVFAAGNERDNSSGCLGKGTQNHTDLDGYGSIPGPGATAKNVITVGAVKSNDLSMTDFSSWGPMRDGRLKPEVVAPGDETGGDAGIKSTNNVSDAYTVLSGTSMAAPAVSGIIGLMIQSYKNTHSNRTFNPATAKAILTHTAAELNNTGPDFTTGYGFVNATRSIDLILKDNTSNATRTIVEDNVTNGANRTYHVIVPEGQSGFKVTLAWDDPQGSVSAALELVNDLDLLVIAPNGTRLFPWTLSNASRNLNANRNQTNTIDVLEQVFANDSMVAGVWTVAVNASVATGDRQNFSLVSNNAMYADNISWNTTLIEINTTQGNTTNGTALILSFTQNNNTNVSELSGNGTAITSSNTTSNALNFTANNTTSVMFSCAPTGSTAAGIYSTLYLVNSSNSTPTGFNHTGLTVKCNVLSTSSPTINLMLPAINNSTTISRSPNITFNFTDSDNTTAVAVLYINRTANASNTTAQNNTPTNFTASLNNEGIYTFWVNVSDNISNISSSIYQLIVDTTLPPNVSDVTAGQRDASWINATWTIPTDNTSGANHTELRINDTFKSNLTPSTNYYNHTSLTKSTAYEFQLRVVDNAGNVGNWTNTSISTTADTSNPNVSLSSPVNNSNETSGTISLSCSVTDNYALSNASLWINSSGNWSLDQTASASGVSASASFSKSLTAGGYVWNCMANDTAANSAFGTNRTLTITSESGSTTPSRGGGGGELPSESAAIGSVTKGETVVQTFTKSEEHYVEQIRFVATDDLKNAIIKASRFEDRPVSTLPLEAPVFAYLNIEPINFKPSQVKDVEFRFVVGKSWLESRKYSPDDVVLKEYKTSWLDLSTRRVGATGDTYVYNAKGASFSYFALAVNPRAVAAKANVTNVSAENITTKNITGENETNMTAALEEVKQIKRTVFSPLVIIFILALIVILVFAALYSAMHLRKKKLFSAVEKKIEHEIKHEEKKVEHEVKKEEHLLGNIEEGLKEKFEDELKRLDEKHHKEKKRE